MQRNTRKMPIMKLHIKKSFKTEMDQPTLIYLNSLQRSNTQPLSELLKKDQTNSKKAQINKNKSSEHYPNQNKNRLIFQSCQQKLSKPEKQMVPQLLNDLQLIQYRKSIKHLISIFEQRSVQLKKLNEHCIHSPKKIKQIKAFNQNITKEIQVSKNHKLKLLQFKRRLKKSILKTQEAQSPKLKRKNATDLMKAMNIKSPYSYIAPINVIRQNSILAFPQIKYSYKQVVQSPKKKNTKIERSKRTTLGGWRIDINETNYLY